MNELFAGQRLSIKLIGTDNVETAEVIRSGNSLYAIVNRNGERIRLSTLVLSELYEVFRL